MSINVFDLVKDVVSDSVVDQLGSFLGEEKSYTNKAIGAITPTLLGSLFDKGSTQSGAARVLDFFNTNQIDGSLIDNLSGLFDGGNQTDNLMNRGSSTLKFLIGDQLASVVDLISNFSGLKTKSSSSLLKMIAPLIMGVVSRYIKKNGLNSLELKDWFGSQASNVKKSLPGGIESILGLRGLDRLIANFSEDDEKGPSPNGEKVSSQSGGFNIWPWIVGLLILVGLFYFLRKGCAGEEAADVVDTATEKIEDAASQAINGSKEILDDASDAVKEVISSIQLPSGTELKVKAGRFTDKIVKFLSGGDGDTDTPFIVEDLKFETGSDRMVETSLEQLDHLAKVMDAYPDVEIRIEGHTDNSGNATQNLTLSKNRTKSVKAYLVGKGVKAARIETTGFGDTRPIATNDTELGKAKNRRVEVYVTKL